MQAVGTHYGPTRIYGPTGHAIGGTAQQALRSSSAAAFTAAPTHYQSPLPARRSCPNMHLAAGGGGARVTRMSVVWAGWSRWRTRAGATARYGTDDYATAGSGPTHQSGARDSESAASK